ncbi:ATP-dependent carboxylate-amine ligase [Brevundimonas sp.]|uniref:ATP-dependent carboxylate-amine ligase n=1 Tax=Brevundimonas sp. TaxID=1871086 RepID=UPI002737E925|nr:ATP-dependent carboxylate-amine ligase [Brevundimonas sp.]MDP3802392.1 ATP-dependent carboxylate-amine ligase [Brevundimonas sp.]
MAERVLITGARAAAALDMARSLRAAGFEPHLADCSPALTARASGTAGPVHRYASPVHRPAAFARDIRDLTARLDPALIIPACEEIFHLAALAEADGFASRVLAPAPDRLATLHAKDRFIDLCRRLSLPAPDGVTVTDRATLTALADAAQDVVVKAVWSRFGARTLIAPDPAGVAAVAPSPEAPWLVQRRILGEEVSFYAVCHAGRVLAFSAYGSGWRLGGGAAYAFHSASNEVAARLRPMADALAAFAGTGQIACDAIVDAAGQPWLIECNPRATSGVHLFGRSAAFGQALMGRGVAEPVAGLRHVAPALWLDGLPAALNQRRMAAWRDQRRQGLDVVAAPGDGLPALAAMADAAFFGLRALRSGRPLTEAMTADIEWNGRPFDINAWSRT